MTALEPLRIESIIQVFQMLGRPRPPHPHVAVIAASWQEPIRISFPILNRPIVSELYVVSLKRGDECFAEFGRQVHDGQAGTMVFVAPGQTIKPIEGQSDAPYTGEGWTLIFHPDLLKSRPLSAAMQQYRFFGYSAREALHLTDDEREVFTNVVRRLEREASGHPDLLTEEVLTSQIQLLFSYCQRSYARQFQLRATIGGSVASRLDHHLDTCFERETKLDGLPTVKSCARALGYSPDYLSDLLRAETGRSARDHIQHAVIEAAKARLLSSASTASEVAYALGFQHPQQFSRLFRQKTGYTPGDWRARNKDASGRETPRAR